MTATKTEGPAEWIGASAATRSAALIDLPGLADALPQSRRGEDSPSLEEKVIAVNRALSAADLPHAIGGAIALAYYGEPRVTIDVDANVFVPVERWPEVEKALETLPIDLSHDPKELAEERQVRLAWDLDTVHLFFSYDALHEAMPAAVRRMPFGVTEIPIVAPEHLAARKAILDRPKDWVDLEAMLIACDALDIEAIETWVKRLAREGDPRVTKLQETARRTCDGAAPDRLRCTNVSALLDEASGEFEVFFAAGPPEDLGAWAEATEARLRRRRR